MTPELFFGKAAHIEAQRIINLALHEDYSEIPNLLRIFENAHIEKEDALKDRIQLCCEMLRISPMVLGQWKHKSDNRREEHERKGVRTSFSMSDATGYRAPGGLRR